MTDPSLPKPEEPLTSEQKKFLQEIEKEAAKNSEVPDENLEESKYDYYTENNYKVHPKIGLVYTDHATITSQRTLVFGIIKRMGSNLFHGKSIMNSSMPICAYEPYSTLERVARLCCYAPSMLAPLVNELDPLERFKKVMTWAVASMHLGINQQKPYDCLLGETMQAKIGDLEYYAENVITNPPAIMLTGKDFLMYGNYEIVAHAYPNSAKVETFGKRNIEFYGPNPAKFTLTHPRVGIDGIMMGKREFRYKGEITIEDETNKIYGQIRINPYKKGFFASIFSSQKFRDDHIKGFITKNKDLLKNKKNSVFDSKDVISLCEGNWIDNLSFDGKMYWEIGRIMPSDIERIDDFLLPSDTQLREDIILLKNNCPKEAEKLKSSLEEKERNDKKLREEHQKLLKSKKLKN